jgi:ATP-dependent protease ClpP protease subunit
MISPWVQRFIAEHNRPAVTSSARHRGFTTGAGNYLKAFIAARGGMPAALAALARAPAPDLERPNRDRELVRNALAAARLNGRVGAYGPSNVILIEGEILREGDKPRPGAVTVAAVRAQLAELKADGAPEIVVRISSEGGSLRSAMKIYDSLRAFPGRVSARVAEGCECSSAATIILCAADWREAAPDALFMLHFAAMMKGGRGTAAEHRQFAGEIATGDRAMAKLYAARCGGAVAKFEQIMGLSQVLSAKRAAEIGLVHRVCDGSGR